MSTTAQAGLLRHEDVIDASSFAESGFLSKTGLRSRQYSSTSVCSATTNCVSFACDSRKSHAARCLGSSGRDAAKRMFVSHEIICPSPLFASVFVDLRTSVFLCEWIGTETSRTA